jgi:NADH:ubiquinone oxidoreductase subunit 2 (subunit N)
VLILVESLISFGWFLRIGQIVFLGEPSPAVRAARGNSAAISAALILLMVMCLAAPAVGYLLISTLHM